MKQRPVGILLAAGQSTRFGKNKLLYPVIENTPMLLVCAAKLVAVLPDSLVVINSSMKPVASQLEQMGLHVILNEQAEQGMGSSIACGVRASSHAPAWLIMLADMPYIKTDTIRLLANQFENGASIIAPVFDQQRGHPVGFGQDYKQELLALHADTGARDVIKNHADRLVQIAVDDPGVIQDIDQPADVLRQ
ncbi:MAG: nucleotidyltransferase family protein [Gammaproteobacteria bacterium]|nr:MAG: nucleotidyltransferase family protein [Gammaproteobacteria bacterium]